VLGVAKKYRRTARAPRKPGSLRIAAGELPQSAHINVIVNCSCDAHVPNRTSLESHANESTANRTAAIRLKDSFDSTNSL